MIIIKYYTPIMGAKNKKGNALLTIDWYKKHFKCPINEDYFDLFFTESLYEGYYSYPQLGSIFALESKEFDINIQGKIQQIIRKITDEGDCIHVLLKEIQ